MEELLKSDIERCDVLYNNLYERFERGELDCKIEKSVVLSGRGKEFVEREIGEVLKEVERDCDDIVDDWQGGEFVDWGYGLGSKRLVDIAIGLASVYWGEYNDLGVVGLSGFGGFGGEIWGWIVEGILVEKIVDVLVGGGLEEMKVGLRIELRRVLKNRREMRDENIMMWCEKLIESGRVGELLS